MKYTIAFILLFFSTAHADWVMIDTATDPRLTFYIDPNSIKATDSGTVSIWGLIDFDEKQGLSGEDSYYRSRLNMWEVDCKKEMVKKVTTNSYTGRMGTGLMIRSEPGKDIWLRITPREVEKKGFLVACKHPL